MDAYLWAHICICVHIHVCMSIYHSVYTGSAYAICVPPEDFVCLKRSCKLHLHIGYSPDLCARNWFQAIISGMPIIPLSG